MTRKRQPIALKSVRQSGRKTKQPDGFAAGLLSFEYTSQCVEVLNARTLKFFAALLGDVLCYQGRHHGFFFAV